MSDIHAGKRIKCPSCQAVVQAPPAPMPSGEAEPAKPKLVVAKPVLPPGAQVIATPVRRTPTPFQPTSNPFDSIDLGQIPAPLQNYETSWQPPRGAAKKPSTSFAIPVAIAVVGGVLIIGLGIALVNFWPSFQSEQAFRSEVAPNSSSSANGSQSSSPASPGFFGASSNSASVPLRQLPKFPELGAARSLGGVNLYEVNLATANSSQQPGHTTKMRVYLPDSATTPKSLACVLVAPAGTNLLHGNEIDGGDYHDETLPYAQAGMAVVHYSLDGPLADVESFTSERQMIDAMSAAYQKFKAADAGVTNGRIALEFALAKLPQVDPARIYCAGHSSAATVALELAAKEPRIAKVAAYAPITDLTIRLAELRGEPALRQVFQGMEEFIASNSPMSHINSLNCPIFLFHARDDSNENWMYTNAYAAQLRAKGKNFRFESVARGDHYEPMITTGIPKAIKWFKAN